MTLGVVRPVLAALALAALAACAQPAQKSPAAPAEAVPPAQAPAVPPPAVQIPADAPPEPAPGPREPLQIATAGGVVTLQVEFVDDDAERQQGLMFRRSMAPDHGMLFDFQEERDVYFWMKNTYLPLDMVFIAGDGRIIAVAANTKPLDESPVGPGVPARAVLEINAGRADALGIKPGDKVSHRIFGG